ncbi:MAG: YggS family pyridoxal phosphate-dependent enzyme [Dehalococcoidales bacterium]|jgi:hypothetical protein|nr:YggS family pyridoxal phosphate-dependent enzyme [Dehalococcoidales bacterium]MDP6738066.1 YggS family pyridoxal phosphate-dependent enzyme [Dehalococcoidales bacterium]|tara:strand:+ start:966 stop:1625 length:660 start_codon:yes stop_codon:yes gene_type:complete
MATIEQNVKQVLNQLPGKVQLVAAAKSRAPEAILEAVTGGVKIIGENYVQEAERAYALIGNRTKWHFIGHLQKNKAKKMVRLFDMVETVDSTEIAREINQRCVQISKIMPVLIEVNSGRENQKTGVFPENVKTMVKEISVLPNILVMGLMTIGPLLDNPEDTRPYFAATRKLFEEIKGLNLSNVEMKYLSMGMTNSYQVAIEEGANIIRLGRKLFSESA